jgi:pantoate--beta-alanine ligase
MKLFTRKEDYIQFCNESYTGKNVGLVPTMGNLHRGHLNLVQQALSENDFTLVTIFVNPKQFAPNEDFDKYPRTLEQDLSKLKELPGSDSIVVFAPESLEEIYPSGFSTDIEVKGLDDTLCGKSRPGHFKGVTTVVYQLFKLSHADRAYFGQKDYQQFKIIEKMVKDLDIPIQLTMVPIAREKSGLALSSRNQYMTNEQRLEASLINKTLKDLASTYQSDKDLAFKMRQEYLFQDNRWQYLEILDANTLKRPDQSSGEVVVAGAFLMGDTRLIDNIIVRL